MCKIIIKKLYSCLVYGEGKEDKHFLMSLIDLDKFQYHTKKWKFNYSNGYGGSPKDILEKCKNEIVGVSYDLVICFIDLDKLKEDYPSKKWEKEQNKLEKEYSHFNIIWQIDKLEDELKRVLGDKYKGKRKINKIAKKNSTKFINSAFWKKILSIIGDKEKYLDNIKK